jgi:hypothetical protein
MIGASAYSFQVIDVADGMVAIDSRTHWGWRSVRQACPVAGVRPLSLKNELNGHHVSYTVVMQTMTGEIPLTAYSCGSFRRAERLRCKLQTGVRTEGFHDRRYGNLFMLPVGIGILIAAGFQLRLDIRAEAALSACERRFREEREPSIFREMKRPVRVFIRKRPVYADEVPPEAESHESLSEDAARGNPLPY